MSYTNGLDNPELYFQTKLYTGNSGTNAITFDGSENMQPDLVWLKRRDSGSNNHRLCDSVRGVNKQLYSSSTGAQGTSSGVVQSFDSNGFTLNTSDSSVNVGSYVSWNWKEQAGIFDIVTYTGNGSNRTISHNLNSIPTMMIIKNYESGGTNWFVYHEGIGDASKYVKLNQTNAVSTKASLFNSTAPTSSVFSLGTDNDGNENNQDFICYLFGNKQGVSKCGSYVGNGDSSEGPFVFTGFKPSFIIRKNLDGGVTEDWVMEDSKRNTFNPVNEWLAAQSSGGEGANNFDTDFLSNGFKMRSNNDGTNRSGTNYIYMAFAENPFVTSTGVPATAR